MGHGQEYVEIIMLARTSASTSREHDMDLATIFSHITGVSATSHVNLPKLIGCTKTMWCLCVYLHLISLCHSMSDLMT